jgi:hypothetical protein
VRGLIVAALVVCVAYGVGWATSAALDDDPCIAAHGGETDRYEYVERWFPVRTDCRVTTPSGASHVERGSSEVFLAMFGLTLVVGLALVTSIALIVRVTAVVVTAAAAFVVILIV